MTQEELKKSMDDFNKGIHDLRNLVTQRDEQRAKDSGTSDPITRDEIIKLNIKCDELETRYQKTDAEWQQKYTDVFEQMRSFVAEGRKPVGQAAEPKLSRENVKLLTPNMVRALAYGTRNNPEDRWLCDHIFRADESAKGGKEKRVGLLDDTGTGGHYLIPDWAPEYVEALMKALVFDGFPVRKMFPKGDVPLNTLTTIPTAYTFQTGGSITISNPVFSRATWAPIRIGVACPVDGAVVRRGDNAITIVQEEMQKAAALLAEYQMLFGSGSAGQMTGLANLAGNVNAYNMHTTNEYGKFTDTNNVNRLMELISMIEQDDSMMEGWIMNSRTKWNMRAVQTAANGDYLLTVPNNAGDPPLLLSYPYKVTNQIPNTRTVNGKSDCSIIFAGKWSDMIIGVWEDVIVSADPSASYVSGATTYSCRQYDQVLYTIIYEINCKSRHDKSFRYSAGIRDNNAT